MKTRVVRPRTVFLILVVGLIGSLSSSCDKGEILTPEPKPQQDSTSVVTEEWKGDSTQVVIIDF